MRSRGRKREIREGEGQTCRFFLFFAIPSRTTDEIMIDRVPIAIEGAAARRAQ